MLRRSIARATLMSAFRRFTSHAFMLSSSRLCPFVSAHRQFWFSHSILYSNVDRVTTPNRRAICKMKQTRQVNFFQILDELIFFRLTWVFVRFLIVGITCKYTLLCKCIHSTTKHVLEIVFFDSRWVPCISTHVVSAHIRIKI